MQSGSLKKLFFRIPTSLRVEDYRFYLFLNFAYIFAFIAHFLALYPMYAMLDNRVTLVSIIVCMVTDIMSFILIRRGFLNTSFILFMGALIGHTTLAIVIFGTSSSLALYYFTILAMTFFSQWKLPWKMVAGFFLAVLGVGMTYYSFYFPPLTELTSVQFLFWNCSNIMINSFAIGYGIYYFTYIVDTAERKLRYQAEHDLLTGIYNRNSIIRFLVSSLSMNRNKVVAVVMSDLDHFKAINDTYGHLVGDEVLKSVSQILGGSLREGDAVGRFGGEEFILVLPGCHLSSALRVAERIRRSLSETSLDTQAGMIRVTMSFGVSVMQNAWDGDCDLLLKHADEALYRAKNNGRNRVEYK